MLWFTLWFLVILKIPAIYLAWVIWYAYKSRNRRNRRTAHERRHEAINVSTVHFR